ncbi:MAG: amidohydrolase family protein, partial [Betaproteobacteria bacterium]|nr:amidohydrolase family protein [Betaproteobacteria bacterium]
LSNFMLYGTTAHIDAARRLGVAISLAPDWAPSGSKSILGELKVADLVNKNRLGNQLSDRELAAMVTRAPAAAIGWEARLGQLAPGYLADLVVLDERNPNPYRNLIEAIEENVRLVWVQGVALYGDSRLMQGLRAASDIEEAGLFANRRPKMVAMNCPALPTTTLPAVKETLQAALSITPELILKRVSPAQLTTDLAACQSKPADPPTLEDARRAMACRFGLPFEKTLLSPFATSDDGDFFPRLLANPNLPPYLKKLPDYYRRQQ